MPPYLLKALDNSTKNAGGDIVMEILTWQSKTNKTTNGQIVQHPVRPICIVKCCFGFRQSMSTLLSWPKFCGFDSKHKK
jgi:hypothetical protein